MFSLFKKSQRQTANADTNGYPAIVHEIHNEFLSAGDKILNEAKSILEGSKRKSIDKGKRLAELGFKKCPEAVEATVIENIIVTTKELADLVENYKISYPNNKFITEKQVNDICEKYGLVLGSIGWFKGFVPEQKLNQISDFILKKEDRGLWSDKGHFFKQGEVRHQGSYHHIFKIGDNDKYNYAYQSNDGIDFYARDGKNIFGMNSLGDLGFTIHQGGLLIAAPPKDMDVPSNYTQKGFRYEKINPDPVVLQRVMGGYLILAAWGNEASDENVVNEKSN